jgi:hypothetical protein
VEARNKRTRTKKGVNWGSDHFGMMGIGLGQYDLMHR